MTGNTSRMTTYQLCTKTLTIYLYIYIFIYFYLLYSLKYTKEAAIGQSEELVHQHVFENSLNILQV